MSAQKIPAENTDESGPVEDRTGTDTFSRLFGESLDSLLDSESWTPGADLPNTYARMEREVSLAVDRERCIASTVRADLFPRIEARALAGPESGVYGATPSQ